MTNFNRALSVEFSLQSCFFEPKATGQSRWLLNPQTYSSLPSSQTIKASKSIVKFKRWSHCVTSLTVKSERFSDFQASLRATWATRIRVYSNDWPGRRHIPPPVKSQEIMVAQVTRGLRPDPINPTHQHQPTWQGAVEWVIFHLFLEPQPGLRLFHPHYLIDYIAPKLMRLLKWKE